MTISIVKSSNTRNLLCPSFLLVLRNGSEQMHRVFGKKKKKRAVLFGPRKLTRQHRKLKHCTNSALAVMRIPKFESLTFAVSKYKKERRNSSMSRHPLHIVKTKQKNIVDAWGIYEEYLEARKKIFSFFLTKIIFHQTRHTEHTQTTCRQIFFYYKCSRNLASFPEIKVYLHLHPCKTCSTEVVKAAKKTRPGHNKNPILVQKTIEPVYVSYCHE